MRTKDMRKFIVVDLLLVKSQYYLHSRQLLATLCCQHPPHAALLITICPGPSRHLEPR
jgi:hypothetical protein